MIDETTTAPPADVAGMIGAFAHEDERIPREAIAFARANWDSAGPALLGVLEDFAERKDRSDRAFDCAFYATLLMMTQRETRAFAPLARIAREADTMFEIMGDSAGDLLPGVLSATFDGDVDRLWSIVEAAHGDDEARAAALDAYAWLVLSKRIPMEDAEPRFTQAFARLEPKEPAPVWLDLAMTAATLGLSNLLPLVRSACRKGYIPAKVIRMRELEDEFAVGRGDFFRRSAQFVRENAPQDDIFEEMERWAAVADGEVSGEVSGEAGEAGEAEGEWSDESASDDGGPAVNPTRDVGRNDPCPCGSGKKFKKCCLAA